MASAAEISRQSNTRVVELDAIRAIAAINLMLFHFTHVFSVKFGYTTPLGFEYPYGKYGVQLFFMLSGYVNAMTLLSKGSPMNFLVARSIRILPSYLLVVGLNLVLLLLAPLCMEGSYSFGQVLANLTLMPNLFGYECLEPVTWTLQIEVLFYGLLIFMFLGGGFRQPLRSIGWYLAICLFGSVFLDGIQSELVGTSADLFCSRLREVLLFPYFPLFAIGILLYRIRTNAGQFHYNLAGLIAAGFVFHWIDKRDFNPLATLLFTGLLALSSYGKLPILRVRPLVFVSTISYSLYLLHNNLGTVFIYQLNQGGVPPLVCFLLAFPFVVGISAWATYCFERPISAWLRAAWKTNREQAMSRDSEVTAPVVIPAVVRASGQ